LELPARDEREALAIAARILAAEGHESGLAGQLTTRAEKPGTWWTLPFGCGFDEAAPERMVLVDEDLQPVNGGARPNPGVRFHLWIYRKRPDVRAIVHTHAPYASALACTTSPLKTIHMDSAMLHGTAHLPEWPGVPLADDEGRIISSALGEAKTILLANHGLLAAGSSIEEATYLAVFFERAARMQLRPWRPAAAGRSSPASPRRRAPSCCSRRSCGRPSPTGRGASPP
jgi:L-fuculose-phosphate aldolase